MGTVCTLTIISIDTVAFLKETDLKGQINSSLLQTSDTSDGVGIKHMTWVIYVVTGTDVTIDDDDTASHL